jgi:hypothetical protein
LSSSQPRQFDELTGETLMGSHLNRKVKGKINKQELSDLMRMFVRQHSFNEVEITSPRLGQDPGPAQSEAIPNQKEKEKEKEKEEDEEEEKEKEVEIEKDKEKGKKKKGKKKKKHNKEEDSEKDTQIRAPKENNKIRTDPPGSSSPSLSSPALSPSSNYPNSESSPNYSSEDNVDSPISTRIRSPVVLGQGVHSLTNYPIFERSKPIQSNEEKRNSFPDLKSLKQSQEKLNSQTGEVQKTGWMTPSRPSNSGWSSSTRLPTKTPLLGFRPLEARQVSASSTTQRASSSPETLQRPPPLSATGTELPVAASPSTVRRVMDSLQKELASQLNNLN